MAGQLPKYCGWHSIPVSAALRSLPVRPGNAIAHIMPVMEGLKEQDGYAESQDYQC